MYLAHRDEVACGKSFNDVAGAFQHQLATSS
jgi:hypothetical protein